MNFRVIQTTTSFKVILRTGPKGSDGVGVPPGGSTGYVLTKVSPTSFDTAWLPLSGVSVTSVFGRTGAVIAVSGDYTTLLVTENTNLYFTNARAIAAPITGFVSGAGTVTASDTILQAINKLNGNIAAIGGAGVTTFNGRSGTVTSQSGDYTTAIVAEVTNLYFTNARAIASTLTSYASGAGTVSASDTILQAIQKLNGNTAALVTGVSSVFGRAGAVTAQSGDYSTNLVTENTNLYFTNARAIGAVITGYVSGAGTVAATDTILQAIQKLNGNIAAIGGSGVTTFNGRSGTVLPLTGDYTTNLVTESGSLYFTNARAIASTLTAYSSGAGTVSSADTVLQAIQKLNGNTAALVTGVSSVFSRTGAVTAQSGDYTTLLVTENTNLYFTNARAIASTLTSYSSGAGTVSAADTILQAIQKLNGNTAALVTGVSSVFGRAGAVTATSGDYTTLLVTENTNLYFTNARAIASTLTSYSSGAGTVSASDSILQAIQKLNGNIALRALLAGGNAFTGTQTFGDGAISGFTGVFDVQTGTTYTVSSGDNGKIVSLNNASSITVTVPNSLIVGFNCMFVQLGAGQVTFAAGSGATVQNRSGNTKIAGQYGVASIIVYSNSGGSSAIAVLGGDTA